MENRTQYVFLKQLLAMRCLPLQILKVPAVALALAMGIPAPVLAQDDDGGSAEVVQPELERREIKRPRIDTENYEVGFFVGLLSMQDFDSDIFFGARAAYHISESFFFEATYGQSEGDLTSFEELSGGSPLFSDSDREYRYYDLSLGWNLFPGEVFISDKFALNSNFYLTGGVGSTDFVGDSWFTFSFGAGYRLLLNDFMALHIDVRDHMFDRDSFGASETTHNIGFHTGLTFFF